MDFALGCTLGYQVTARTPFLFNIEAQTSGGQRVVRETLSVTPDVPLDRWTMPESGNRYLRLVAPPGRLTIEYGATVAWTPAFEDPALVSELTAETLPLSVFPHLFPS